MSGRGWNGRGSRGNRGWWRGRGNYRGYGRGHSEGTGRLVAVCIIGIFADYVEVHSPLRQYNYRNTICRAYSTVMGVTLLWLMK